jgi:hypothetical protein
MTFWWRGQHGCRQWTYFEDTKNSPAKKHMEFWAATKMLELEQTVAVTQPIGTVIL